MTHSSTLARLQAEHPMERSPEQRERYMTALESAITDMEAQLAERDEQILADSREIDRLCDKLAERDRQLAEAGIFKDKALHAAALACVEALQAERDGLKALLIKARSAWVEQDLQVFNEAIYRAGEL